MDFSNSSNVGIRMRVHFLIILSSLAWASLAAAAVVSPEFRSQAAFARGVSALERAIAIDSASDAKQAHYDLNLAYQGGVGDGFYLAKSRYWLDRMLRKEHTRARTFLLDHGHKTAKAALLVHGLAADAGQLLELGQRFYENGYNVLGVAVADLSTGEHTSAQVVWQGWYRQADYSYQLAAMMGEKVVAVGYSSGADLCLLLSRNYPQIDGLVLISCIIKYQPNFLDTADYSIAAPWLPVVLKRSGSSNCSIHPREKEQARLRAALVALVSTVSVELQLIRQATLIIQSDNDGLTNINGAEYIYNNISSNIKRLVIFDGAPHQILAANFNGYRRVSDEIMAFVVNYDR